MCVKEILSWKGIPNHPLNTFLEKERFGLDTEWYGSTIAWKKSNDSEVLSLAKAKTFGSWHDVFVGRDDGGKKYF